MRRSRYFALPLSLILLFSCGAEAKGVREELARRQKETGLTLSDYSDGAIASIEFAKRSWQVQELPLPGNQAPDGILSPDGRKVAFSLTHRTEPESFGVIDRDGSNRRDYPYLTSPQCWSRDSDRLLVQEPDPTTHGKRNDLAILNLKTGDTRIFGVAGYAESQCWSPDEKQIVYSRRGSGFAVESDSNIIVYDVATSTSHILTHGSQPTWSPNGEWIAFLEEDAYYLIRPSGKERKLLFRKRNVFGPLYWSPDSQMVAYSHCCYFWPMTFDLENVRLRIRRLSDGAEMWITTGSLGSVHPLQWLQPGKSESLHTENHKGH